MFSSPTIQIVPPLFGGVFRRIPFSDIARMKMHQLELSRVSLFRAMKTLCLLNVNVKVNVVDPVDF